MPTQKENLINFDFDFDFSASHPYLSASCSTFSNARQPGQLQLITKMGAILETANNFHIQNLIFSAQTLLIKIDSFVSKHIVVCTDYSLLSLKIKFIWCPSTRRGLCKGRRGYAWLPRGYVEIKRNGCFFPQIEGGRGSNWRQYYCF